MNDFREELHVIRHKENGKDYWFPFYDFTWTRIDLSNDTEEIIESDQCASIGTICEVIDRFGGTEATVKARLIHFIDLDTITLIEEY